jgi:hypothetical protein
MEKTCSSYVSPHVCTNTGVTRSFPVRATNTFNTAVSSPSLRSGELSAKLSARRAVDVVRTHRHGLSYTTFALSDLDLSTPAVADSDFSLTATATVTNTGSVAGSEVVQLYVSMPKTSDVTHPPRLLRAFGKARNLAPGASARVVLALDKIAVSYWDDGINRWVIERGEYGVSVGPSSDVLPLTASFVVNKTLEWSGL